MNQNIIEHIIKLENELKTFKTELKTLKEMMLAPVNPVVKKQKNKRIPFSALGIVVGEVFTYRPKKSKQDKIGVIVADDYHIEFNGKLYSMSDFDYHMANSGKRQGPLFFEYKGENLVDLRKRLKL